jgi:hypothetical protein
MSIESRLADVEESLRLLRNANQLQSRHMSATAPASLQVIAWDATNKKWIPFSPPSARVYNDANITGIVSGEETALTFNQERFDTNTIHSTSSNTGRLTAKTAGKYIISASAQWSTATATNVQIFIQLNGSTKIGRSIVVDADYRQMSVTTIYELAVDDYVELVVHQATGGDKIIAAASNGSPEFMMAWVAP